VDQDTTGAAVVGPGPGPGTLTLTVLHVKGKLVRLGLRWKAEDIEFVVDGKVAASTNRARLRSWLLAARGNHSAASRPFMDLPLTLHHDHGHVAPTLVEAYNVSQIITFITTP
jgi:hypothetical protein